MGTFFQDLLETESYKANPKRWAELLDWLACGKRFDRTVWTSKEYEDFINELTERGKTFGEFNWSNAKKSVPEEICWNNVRSADIQFKIGYIVKKDQKCISLVNHIRNIIFHGYAVLLREKIVSFEGFDSDNTGTSAYIWMPLDFLMEIFDIYQKIENGNKTAQKEGGNER